MTLLELLASELERPREITRQVIDHIAGTYEIEREDIGSFLEDKLPELEDYEHDLILSPLFTPKFSDQTRIADLLGAESVAKERWPEMIQQLAARPTQARLITSDNQVHVITLRDVSLERYVHRLRLDGIIHPSVLQLLEARAFAAEKPVLKAIARRAIWENSDRRDILIHFLSAADKRGGSELGDAGELLRLAEDYKPANVANLIERIPVWQEGLRQEIEGVNAPKPFLSAATQAVHGNRLQQHQDATRIEAKKKEYAFLGRLHELLVG